jgi:quercetin dioxygenase-like cupin family protein
MSEVITVGSMRVRFLVESDDSDGSVAVFEVDVEPGGRAPAPHSHDGWEETFYGLAGVTTWTVEGRTIELARGNALCVPRGDVHSFDNLTDEYAKFLGIVSPGVLGPDFFREVGAVIAEAGGGRPDRERVGQVMRRHGLTPAAPVPSG